MEGLNQMIKIDILPDTFLLFLNLAPTLPTMPLSDITGGLLSHYMQPPLEGQKALYYFLHI